MKNILSLFLTLILLSPTVFGKDLRFVQITDVKYDASSKNDTLKTAINTINKERDVNFVVFTGDNIARPKKENLKGFLSEAKKLKAPFYVVVGDKDVNKRKDFGKKEYTKCLKKNIRGYKPKTTNYAFERSGIVFLAADGAKEVIPSTTGYYKDNVLEWLDANLDLYSDKPVVILQHFPIIPPVNKETYYTFKADEYLKVLSKHNNVKAIVAGHFGVNKEDTINGIIHISTAPLPCYRVIDLIDYDSDNMTIWAEVKEIQ